jgi:hypothetical protein
MRRIIEPILYVLILWLCPTRQTDVVCADPMTIGLGLMMGYSAYTSHQQQRAAEKRQKEAITQMQQQQVAPARVQQPPQEDDLRKRLARLRGRQSTILTGPIGQRTSLGA